MVYLLLAVVLLALVVAALLNYLAPLRTFAWLRDLGRRAAGLRVHRTVAQGQVFPYLEGGSGAPLVLVHGFTANKDAFTAVGHYLTPHYRVIVPDLPGFGDSSRDPGADYGYEAQVAHLHAFVSALGLTRFHLGGNSMGGGIAALYAALHPQAVASLWLLDAAATNEVTQSALYQDFLASGKFALLTETPQEHPQKMALVFGKVPFIPWAVHHALGVQAAADYALHHQIFHAIRGATPLEQRVERLDTPTLIVTGTLDQVVPPAAVETLARIFVNHRIVRMPGVGHIPMVEAPKQTARDYLAFAATQAEAVPLKPNLG
jgi:triacylglycerol lipase